MTRILLADADAAADLAGYLARLLRHDRRAAVRVRADGPVLATFGHPPFGEGAGGVIALRTSPLAVPAHVDVTVSAGQFLDALAPDGSMTVPPPLTGPTWAGLLPPRGGWRPVADLDVAALGAHVARAVGEFRARVAALPPEGRVRSELDRLAGDLWNRPVPDVPGGDLPLRAAHAARSLGFLTAAPGGTATARVLVAGGWTRLDAPFGSVFTRRAGAPRLLFAR